MNAKEIKNILLKELKDSKKTYLIVNKSENFQSGNIMILNHLIVKMKLCGIYVTLNRPYPSISTFLEKDNIDVSKLFFVDCTGNNLAKNIKTDKCNFLNNSQSLTELSLTITKLINLGKFDFLFLDSISTLLVYNNLETTEKFMHYLINKLRVLNIGGVMISLNEDKSNKLIPVISQFCDKIIKI